VWVSPEKSRFPDPSWTGSLACPRTDPEASQRPRQEGRSYGENISSKYSRKAMESHAGMIDLGHLGR
jgi:hypothetical protein